MTDEAKTTEAAPEAPPLWGETVFQRSTDGAPDFHAHVKVSGENVRAEGAGCVEKGEVLTDPKGGCWTVAEAKHRADGGYSWLTLAPARAEGQGPEQHELNQSTPEPSPEPRKGRKVRTQDAEQSVASTETGEAGEG